MKKNIPVLVACMFALIAQTFAQDKYAVTIDLNRVVDDKIQVTYQLPKVDQDTIEFQIPKIVPGTYSIYDFGRFLEDFKAYDATGRELSVKQITDNRFAIGQASTLASLSYWVEDTYDTDKGNVIFEPAGSNIQQDTSFVVNTFTMVGYLQGMKDLPYEVTVNKPSALFGASALDKKAINDSTDLFTTNNYFDLADGPIMYSVPDTVTFTVGGAKILISVYSPGGILTSAFVRDQIEPTLEAQKAYMGGQLPVDNYAFLIYLFQGGSLSGGYGALEHSYSSMYNLPEADPNYLAQVIRDVAAHEFFHIVTPLNIHSEEIGDFDFINPKMSKHLWLYEGMTEYAAGLAQVKYGEMSTEEYLKVINDKITQSKKFQDNLPFTEMSENCLDETKEQYYNVYQKGALIGMSLDIKLRQLSGGEYGVEQMMIDLSKEFGKEKSFQDEALFDIITKMTYPEVRGFFAKYVEGTESIPYEDFLYMVGVKYSPGVTSKELSVGNISFGVKDSLLTINSTAQVNVFGEEMGYQDGDVLYEFDKKIIDIGNYKEVLTAYKEGHQEGDMISAVVLRDNGKGKLKKVKLKAKAIAVDVKKPGVMELMENASSEQLALRKSWINK
ncbi:peptidase M61 [Reichenbachiella agarivorans]|uniref:Peptidase M61 n=1 Tax=Reichenbachiella agarivorans TaxID=2979464 RepID=A0ABY6CTT8_9BACT|nr:peptidase M61 [Reichenbachiella agarivorans]UXP33937.1 peptidase M61 [Reichenbachiella agarivorans]